MKFIGQADNTGTFGLLLFTLKQRLLLDKTMWRYLTGKGTGELTIIISVLDTKLHVEILGNFLILSTENSLEELEVIFVKVIKPLTTKVLKFSVGKRISTQ